MIDVEWVRLMARYNRWQNDSIYGAAAALDDVQRRADRGAFFGSIHATLNHILWGDRIWMSRLAGWGQPAGGIRESLRGFDDWEALIAARKDFDAALLDWAVQLDESALAGTLDWYSAALEADRSTPRWLCVTHMFNHQTHHRGQVHAMLTAGGRREAGRYRHPVHAGALPIVLPSTITVTYGRRCIPAGGVARRLHIPICGAPRALPAGRLDAHTPP